MTRTVTTHLLAAALGWMARRGFVWWSGEVVSHNCDEDVRGPR